MLSGRVQHFPAGMLGFRGKIDNSLIISSTDAIWEVTQSGIRRLLAPHRSIHGLRVFENQMWVDYEGANETLVLDGDGKQVGSVNLGEALGWAEIHNNRLVGIRAWHSEQECIYSYDFHRNEVVSERAGRTAHLAFDDAIFALEERDTYFVSRFDDELKEIWSTNLDDVPLSGTRMSIGLSKNHVILVGAHSKREGLIKINYKTYCIALDRASGERVWSTTIDKHFLARTVGQSYVYLIRDGIASLVCAQTGKHVSDVEIGQKLPGGGEAAFVCEFEGYALSANETGSAFRLWDLSLQTQYDEVRLPEDGEMGCVNRDNVPRILDGVLYLKLGVGGFDYGACSAILPLKIVSDPDQAGISIEDRPEFDVQRCNDPEGGIQYRLSAVWDSVDDLLRFAEIEAHKTARLKGQHIMSVEHRDREFSGRIVVAVPRSDAIENRWSEFEAMAARVTRALHGDVYAGTGGEIRVEVSLEK